MNFILNIGSSDGLPIEASGQSLIFSSDLFSIYTRLPTFREDATTLDGSNYILTLVDGFLVPKENGSLEDERREEISGLDSFPTPVTIPSVTTSTERFGSRRQNSSENVLETQPNQSIGDVGEVETESLPEANIVDTEAKFPKTPESGISGINDM